MNWTVDPSPWSSLTLPGQRRDGPAVAERARPERRRNAALRARSPPPARTRTPTPMPFTAHSHGDNAGTSRKCPPHPDRESHAHEESKRHAMFRTDTKIGPASTSFESRSRQLASNTPNATSTMSSSPIRETTAPRAVRHPSSTCAVGQTSRPLDRSSAEEYDRQTVYRVTEKYRQPLHL